MAEISKSKSQAQQITELFNNEDLASKLTEVLRAEGIEDLIVSEVVLKEPSEMTLSFGAPCPTKCRVLEDGSISCRPEC